MYFAKSSFSIVSRAPAADIQVLTISGIFSISDLTRSETKVASVGRLVLCVRPEVELKIGNIPPSK